jgi:hypothetical protein
MKDAQDIKNWLQDKDLRVIERKTGISYYTLWHIKRGQTKRVTDFTAAELEALMQ